MSAVDGKSRIGGDLMRKRVVREVPPEKVRVKMRRNREEAVERGSTSVISLISLAGAVSFICKYLFGIWLVGNADGGRKHGDGEPEKPSFSMVG